jgi:hypothetical protein
LAANLSTDAAHKSSSRTVSCVASAISLDSKRCELQNSTLDVCAIEAVPLEDLDTAAVQSGKTTAEQELAKATVSISALPRGGLGKNYHGNFHRAWNMPALSFFFGFLDCCLSL